MNRKLSHNRIRLYIEEDLAQAKTIALNKNQGNYLANVMRRKAGDAVNIFNGRDGEWAAEISDVRKSNVDIILREQVAEHKTAPDIWLLFAPIKMGRIDFLVEKATELGAAELWPVFTERTIVDRVNIERLKSNAIEAAEQSERLCVPIIHEPQKLMKILDGWDENRMLILADESGKAKNFAESLKEKNNNKWAILIGPEGGFTDKEFEMLYNKDFVVPVSLGPRILRADTAALAAMALWQQAKGDFK